METIYFESVGKPEDVLRFGQLPLPKRAEDEALIKVIASSVNPADFFFIAGTYAFKPRFPQVAGMDAVGVVAESAGPFKEGDMVAFRHPGVWAEYAAIPIHKLIPVSLDLSLDKAAQLYLNPGTAWGLLESASVNAGDWVAVNAANSTVAKILSQMAERRGIHVVAIVRNAEKAANLKEYGAKEVIDMGPHKEAIHERILSLTGGKGVSALFDAVGGGGTTELIKAMRVGGTVIAYGLFDEAEVSYHNSSIIYKQLTIKGFRVMSYFDSLLDMQGVFRNIVETIKPREFRIDIHERFPLKDFASAIKASSAGKVLFLADAGLYNSLSLKI